MEILVIGIINTVLTMGLIIGIDKIKKGKKYPNKSIEWYELT